MVQFRVGGSMSTGDAIQWKPPVDFNLNSDQYKIDTRVSGRYLNVWIGQFNSAPTSSNWRFSGMDIELSEAGGR